jgi:hypothetical protein
MHDVNADCKRKNEKKGKRGKGGESGYAAGVP